MWLPWSQRGAAYGGDRLPGALGEAMSATEGGGRRWPVVDARQWPIEVEGMKLRQECVRWQAGLSVAAGGPVDRHCPRKARGLESARATIVTS
jgi:hypothetical protein